MEKKSYLEVKYLTSDKVQKRVNRAKSTQEIFLNTNYTFSCTLRLILPIWNNSNHFVNFPTRKFKLYPVWSKLESKSNVLHVWKN